MDSTSTSIAPISARLLALFIDYVFLSALIFFVGKAIGHSDFVFIPTLFITGFYFTYCNSELASGQSLGKRVLGLRVVGDKDRVLIDPAQSALRYLLSFGLIILLSEVPVSIYRMLTLVAEPFYLEMHMLVVMVFASTSLFFAALTKSQKSIHDIVCNTIVVRSSEVPSKHSISELKPLSYGRERFSIFCISAFVAIALWAFGVVQPHVLDKLVAHKYQIEAQFDVRIISLGVGSGPLEIIALSPSSKEEEKKTLAKELGAYVLDQKLIDTDVFKKILFLFHGEQDTTQPIVIHFDTISRIAQTEEKKSL